MDVSIYDRIKSSGSYANLDKKYGPYVSREAAHAALGPQGDDVIVVGLTVGIKPSGSSTIEEYWYKDGTALQNLVRKQIADNIPASALAGNIPASKLSTDVQTSLGKANTSYQKPGSGIPATDLEASVQEAINDAETAVQPEDIDDAARLGEEYSSAIVPEIGADAVLLKAQQTLTLAEKEQVVSNIFNRNSEDAPSSGLSKVYLKRNVGYYGLEFLGFDNPQNLNTTDVLEASNPLIFWDNVRKIFVAKSTAVALNFYEHWTNDYGYKNLTTDSWFYITNGTAKQYYKYNGTTVVQNNNPLLANILTQDMLYKGDAGSRVPNTNTIFVIQDDFNLNNDVIEIPEGCVLEFDGGSIDNGKIELNDTVISPTYNSLVDNTSNLAISGIPADGTFYFQNGKPTWSNSGVWVDAKGVDITVATSGATADRPVGSEIYIGFMYFDTTLGLPIYASAISGDTVTWVDAAGNDPDA